MFWQNLNLIEKHREQRRIFCHIYISKDAACAGRMSVRLCSKKHINVVHMFSLRLCSKTRGPNLHVLAASGSDYLKILKAEMNFLSHLYLKIWHSLELYPFASAQKSKRRRHGQKSIILRIMATLSASIPSWPIPCLPSRCSLLKILLQIIRLWFLSQMAMDSTHVRSSAFALYFISYLQNRVMVVGYLLYTSLFKRWWA